MHQAKILADSVSPDGVRLTSFEITYPRIIHAEMMTHRVFSRNAASSRAIPVHKMISAVVSNPYIPSEWGKNQRGMQAEELVSGELAAEAKAEWLAARDSAVAHAEKLLELGIHKQLTNRLLEPFQWYTAIFTATEWDNFWHLRNHKDAHPDIRMTAEKMGAAYDASTPKQLGYGEWHLPLISEEDWAAVAGFDPEEALDRIKKISMGRCARVSYLTHDGRRDHEKDIELYDRLFVGGHMSPFEHVATPIAKEGTDEEKRITLTQKGPALLHCSSDPSRTWSGNFRGWHQYRKTIPNEWDLLGARTGAAE